MTIKSILFFSYFFINFYAQVQEILIVKNPSTPIVVEEIKSTFELLYTIGKSSEVKDENQDNEFKLLAPMGLVIDSKNNYYILDAALNKVNKFNAKGEFLFSFGERGDEEGEFISPKFLSILGSNILVFDTDNHRISYFNLKGEFIKSVELEKINLHITQFFTTSNHYFVVANTYRNDNNSKTLFLKYNRTSLEADTLYEGKMTYYKSDKKEFFHFLPIQNEGYYLFDYGARKEFTIEKLDQVGDLKTVIKKTISPIKFTKEEKNDDNLIRTYALMPGFTFPDYKNFIKSVWIDENHNLCICSLGQDGNYGIDIFNKKGKYVVRLPYQVETKSVYYKGKIYQVEIDGITNLPYVAVYKLTYKIPNIK